jgi:hypothetical protein
MDRENLKLTGWRLRRLARGLHWSTVLALGLVAFDVTFHYSAVAPLLQERTRLRAEAAKLHAVVNASPVRDATTPGDPELDLAAFYAALASPANAPELLRRLHLTAQAHGLRLEHGEYRPLADPGGKLTRYQILLPAKGTYPEVRRFLTQAGREIPGLSLDGISFQRQKIGDEALQAQIKFTLFLSTQG